jgi:hypothetical protein
MTISILVGSDSQDKLGTMIPSAAVAVPTVLGNPNLNWIGTTNLNVDKRK